MPRYTIAGIFGSSSLTPNAGIFLVHRFPVAFTIDVNADTGLIDRWSAVGIAHAGPFQTRYAVDARYADVTAEMSVPAGLFGN